jgi:hypothetical protein
MYRECQGGMGGESFIQGDERGEFVWRGEFAMGDFV